MPEFEQMPAAQREFLKQGYLVQDYFFTAEQCTHFLDLITQFQQRQSLAVIHRAVLGRPLHYKVIDGIQIEQDLPEIQELYERLNLFVRDISGMEMVPLKNKQVGVNVNITPHGGTYRWHYDRNAVTVLLYLNEVQGGEIEFYPLYRLLLKGKIPAFWQRLLDKVLQVMLVRRIIGDRIIVRPMQGRMVVMRGNKCLHSVRPVKGDQERINIVLAYDTPDEQSLAKQALDQYLYSQEPVSSDPNYTTQDQLHTQP
jgi:hypothetical protein